MNTSINTINRRETIISALRRYLELGNLSTKYITYIFTTSNVNRSDNSRKPYYYEDLGKLQTRTHLILIFPCKRGIDAVSEAFDLNNIFL